MAKQPQAAEWYRKVVPAGYERATLSLTGTAPLLMKSGSVDRDSDDYRAFEALSQKQRKTVDDRARLRELEWTLALYFDDDLGPYIPGGNVHELLREAATKWRLGAEIMRSLVVLDYRLPLLFDGPREAPGLWAAGFRDTRMAANSGANRGRVERTRPMFPRWSLVVELAFDPEDLDYHRLTLAVERAQKFGLGDYRPLFGSFSSLLIKGELVKALSNGNPVDKVVRENLLAHQAFVDRVMVAA